MGPGFRRDDNGYFAHSNLDPDLFARPKAGVTIMIGMQDSADEGSARYQAVAGDSHRSRGGIGANGQPCRRGNGADRVVVAGGEADIAALLPRPAAAG